MGNSRVSFSRLTGYVRPCHLTTITLPQSTCVMYVLVSPRSPHGVTEVVVTTGAIRRAELQIVTTNKWVLVCWWWRFGALHVFSLQCHHHLRQQRNKWSTRLELTAGEQQSKPTVHCQRLTAFDWCWLWTNQQASSLFQTAPSV